MASGLVSYVQLLSTELALKAIEQQGEHCASAPPEANQSNTATAARAADEHAPMRVAPILSLVPETPEPEEAETEITGASFMRSLKEWIGEISADPARANQGSALAQALTSGTLRISDPIEGIAVTAWDIAGTRPRAIKRDEISTVGWSQFLKQRVKREDAGYFKDADGNYMDMISGESAYFGAVGSRFYYLTWPMIAAKPL